MKAKIVDSLKLAAALLQAQTFPLLGLFIVGCSLNLTAEDAMQLLTPAQETERWTMQFMVGIWELVQLVLTVLLLSWALPRVRKFKATELLAAPFETPYLKPLFAEYLRRLARVLLWGILFVAPGFIRYCQLVFVPFIALFSKSYREGKTDAFQLSERLTKGRLPLIAGVILFATVLQVVVEFTPQMMPDMHTLPLRVTFYALEFLIEVWCYSMKFVLFESFLRAEES